MAEELTRWLAGLAEAELVTLLQARPDVLVGLPPLDLTDLAQRLARPESLVLALQVKPIPYLQLMEAAVALGQGTSGAALMALLADGDPSHPSPGHPSPGHPRPSDPSPGHPRPSDPSPSHAGHVSRIVDDLCGSGLLSKADGLLTWPPAMAELFGQPLGLGPPAHTLLAAHSVDSMRRLQAELGLKRTSNRAATLATMLAFYADADGIRDLIATAPDEVAEWLLAQATGGNDDAYYDPHSYPRRKQATDWALARGLLLPTSYAYDVRMPGEVARALRGPDYRAPFEPVPPIPAVCAVPAEQVRTSASAAATQFADYALTILDHLARASLPTVKSGGVGVREITRLAKIVTGDEPGVRLVLELAYATGLLAHGDGAIGVSDNFERWRAGAPEDRLAALLSTWWHLGAVPTASRDAEGKVLRALEDHGDCEGCRLARVGLIEAMADLGGASDLEDVAERLLWSRPLVHCAPQDADTPFATIWREAETLGVIAHGVLSDAGRAVQAGDTDRLVNVLAGVLPASADTALFGADLTVLVSGAPSHRVSVLLDSTADRESRGGAVTWRFSPASVRRALDDGARPAELITALTAISTSELPQPLRYLIGDVARRHGHLRVGDAVGFVRSDDEPLLAEIAGNRKLGKLGLRLIAPTVLAADVPTGALLAALRAAGYFPIPDGPDEPGSSSSPGVLPPQLPSNVRVLDAARQRLGNGSARSRHARLPDVVAVARALRAAGVGALRSDSATERRLRQANRRLADVEIRQLAHAIETGTRVGLRYESGSGGVTSRVIDSIEFSGTSLYAWCELRQDQRWFTVSRILGVVAV